jgi:ABC-2 type transport system ATP-binding protein
MEAFLRAEGLSQSYRRRTVLSGVDIATSHRRTALLGPNGAGKTTLLRTLATVVPPRTGRIIVDGRELVSDRDVRRARASIGWLPQHFGYFPGFTAYDFVRYVAWLRCVPAGRVDAAAREALAAVGLGSHEGTVMRRLSGGMLRRCGIAAAIVGGPRLLLLDEPTVGLDPEQRLEFRELIRDAFDGAVMLSTHLVEDAAAMCDHVIVLHRGRVVFRGSVREMEAAAVPDARGDTPLERGFLTVLARGTEDAR